MESNLLTGDKLKVSCNRPMLNFAFNMLKLWACCLNMLFVSGNKLNVAVSCNDKNPVTIQNKDRSAGGCNQDCQWLQ